MKTVIVILFTILCTNVFAGNKNAESTIDNNYISLTKELDQANGQLENSVTLTSNRDLIFVYENRLSALSDQVNSMNAIQLTTNFKMLMVRIKQVQQDISDS